MTTVGKFLVVGSNSFSGATFVDYLLSKDIEVIGVSRSAEPDVPFLPYRWDKRASNFRFSRIDLNTQLDELMKLVTAERPAYVVNFAAQSMVAESWQNPDHWFITNVVSTVRFHERLRHCDFLAKYIHVTTPEVYGSTDGFIKEDAPFNPSTPYAVSRAAGDMSLRTYFKAYGFPVVFTRAANVYGPGQRLYRIIPRTIFFIRTGQKLSLHGGGTSVRSFIHVRDVADGTFRAAIEGKAGETFHFSTKRTISIRDVVELICDRLKAEFSSHVEVIGERLGKDSAYKLDSGKARKILGWADKVSLENGIDETITWVDKFLPKLKLQEVNYVHKP